MNEKREGSSVEGNKRTRHVLKAPQPPKTFARISQLDSTLEKKRITKDISHISAFQRPISCCTMPPSLALILLFGCWSIASFAYPIQDEEEAALFLQKFGYLEDSTGYRVGALVGPDAVQSAIKDFQRFAGINQTGSLDNDTLVMMNTPRCGNKDKIGPSSVARRKRYALQGSKWRTTDLTYRISKYPERLKDKTKIDKEIARAFKIWSDITTLTFGERKRGRVNIDIRFETGEHGDGDPFDGPGKTLAHAFFPQFGGDAHFDNEEKWTINERSGTNLFQVAAHEFGHSLGLSHSDEKRALMAPYYRGFQSTFKLDTDDVKAIQSLYGSINQPSPPEEEEPSGPPPDTSDAPDLCQDATIDTITRTQNGSTYVFKGDFYWKILQDAIADGYPRKISDDWGGLEGNMDASLTWSNGKTYFFKGGRYWRFTNKEMDSGYPKLLERGFEGIPDMLDAAFVWSGNGKTYFFKGDKYWRYDSNSDPPVSDKYPKPISNWNGLPNNLDAAFQWENSRSYFFKGDKYYRFNDVNFQVDTGDPAFPRSTSTWWFDCSRGQPTTPAVVTEPSPGPPPDINDAPDLCRHSTIDTITRTQDGKIYVFRGYFYWKMLLVGGDTSIAEGYPRKISDDWGGLEGNIDASFTLSTGKTYFFKGGRYWCFTNKKMDSGYPKLISSGFNGIPDMLDAAFVFNGNGKTYFFKGDKYWGYDSSKDPPVSDEYPQPISDWIGVPNNLDAAIEWDDSASYFFKGNIYYKFNHVTEQVDTDAPGYERSTSRWWFDCFRDQPTPPEIPRPNIEDAPDLCQDATMDAVTRKQNGITYFFKGDFYWKYLQDTLAQGYPKIISDVWSGLEGNIDASFTWSNDKTFFFKGGRYWRFTKKKMDIGYPKLITRGFEGIPDMLDAAFFWNGKTYFLKGDQYWGFDSNNDPPVDDQYPEPISDWNGLPNNLDAALGWDRNVTYFFKGKFYYRFNHVTEQVDTDAPGYERSTSRWWFNC